MNRGWRQLWARPGAGVLILCSSLGLPLAHAGEVLEAVPAKPDAGRRYVIYLHGGILEQRGVHGAHSKQHGFYDHAGILKAIANRGFVVVGEARPSGTRIERYAQKVSDQVNTLLAAGVPANSITVAGFSKGGAIALVAATLAGNPETRFVVMAGCGIGEFARVFEDIVLPYAARMKGRVLSLYDAADREAASCRRAFEKAGAGFHGEERVLHTGRGHGLFYRVVSDWVEPVVAWTAR